MTINEIAKICEVSPSTVSNVINNRTNKVSKEKAEKINKIMKKYNFEPSLAASMLSHKQRHIIAIVMTVSPEDSNFPRYETFFSKLILSIENKIRDTGYFPMIYTYKDINEIAKLESKWHLAAVISIGVDSSNYDNLLKDLNIPVVFIDGCYQGTNLDKYYNVGIDDKKGGELITNYILNKNHQKILYVSDFENLQNVDLERYNGYKKALVEHNLLPLSHFFLEDNNDQFNSSFEKLEQTIKNNEITAIFCCSDFIAFTISLHFFKKGYKIPDDISIAGFDNSYYSHFIEPGFTTVQQNILEKGYKSIDMAINLIKNKKTEHSIILPIELIDRGSIKEIN